MVHAAMRGISCFKTSFLKWGRGAKRFSKSNERIRDKLDAKKKCCWMDTLSALSFSLFLYMYLLLSRACQCRAEKHWFDMLLCSVWGWRGRAGQKHPSRKIMSLRRRSRGLLPSCLSPLSRALLWNSVTLAWIPGKKPWLVCGRHQKRDTQRTIRPFEECPANDKNRTFYNEFNSHPAASSSLWLSYREARLKFHNTRILI